MCGHSSSHASNEASGLAFSSCYIPDDTFAQEKINFRDFSGVFFLVLLPISASGRKFLLRWLVSQTQEATKIGDAKSHSFWAGGKLSLLRADNAELPDKGSGDIPGPLISSFGIPFFFCATVPRVLLAKTIFSHIFRSVGYPPVKRDFNAKHNIIQA